MIFTVLDPSPLTVCINCSFFTFIVIKNVVDVKDELSCSVQSALVHVQEGLRDGVRV